MMHIFVMSSNNPIRIYMGVLILDVKYFVQAFLFFKLFPMVSKGLKTIDGNHTWFAYLHIN